MAKLRRNFDDEVEEDEIYDSDYDDEDEDDYDGEDYDDDEEDYDDEDDEDTGRSNLVKYGIIGAVIVAIIGGSLLIRGNQPKKDTKPKTEHVEKSSSKASHPKETSSSSSSSVTSNGENAETAKASLERPEAPATDEETSTIAGKIGEAVEKIKTTPGLKNDQASGLFLTNNTMLTTLQTMIGNGYQFDQSSVKAFKSDNDNVLQFLATFKKEGQSDITLTGNWSPELQQLGFVQMHGDLKIDWKDSGTPQVGDAAKNAEESDKPLHPEDIIQH